MSIGAAISVGRAPAWAQGLPPAVLPDVRLEQLPPTAPPKPPTGVEIPKEAPTQPPIGAAEVRFVLTGVEIEGATAYPASELSDHYKKLIGTEVDLTKIYEISREIQTTYRRDGYFLTRVIVPAQTIREGRVRIRVLEGFISEVSVDGDLGAVEELVTSYLKTVTEERPIRLATLERALLLANDIPGVSISGLLQPSTTELGAADLVATATRKPFDGLLVVDNYGDDFTGQWETALGLSSNSFTSLGERVTAVGFATNVFNGWSQKVGQLSTSWRLGADGLYLDTIASYGDSNPGASLQDLDFKSKTLLLSATAGYPVIRSRNLNFSALVGFDFTDSNTDVFGTEKFSRDKLRVAHASGVFDFRDSWRGSNAASASFRQGLPILNATRRKDEFKSTPDGTGSSTLVRGTVSRLQGLYGNFTLFGTFAGQYAFNDLLSDQEFDVGGTRFGRGYDQKEISGDQGIGVTTEIQYTRQPNWSFLQSFQVFGFYDYGQVWNRGDSGVNDSLSSTGIGVRLWPIEELSLDLQVAWPLTRDSQRANGGRNPQLLFRAVGRI
jgi:hemolysin activation/secretion protein